MYIHTVLLKLITTDWHELMVNDPGIEGAIHMVFVVALICGWRLLGPCTYSLEVSSRRCCLWPFRQAESV